jgi:hypothetical protein
MANTTQRGGKSSGGKHLGVRKGSTGTRKERHQVENRKPVFDEEAERSQIKRANQTTVKVSGRNDAYKNKPKARKVR